MEEKSDVYNEFIKGLSLKKLFILESEAKREEDFKLPANITIEKEHIYKNEKGKVKVYIQYTLKAMVEGKKEPGVSISIKYLLEYKSDVEMTDEFFDKFAKTSLLIETWPYFRQYVHETILNMGLPPLVLDILPFSKKKRAKKKE